MKKNMMMVAYKTLEGGKISSTKLLLVFDIFFISESLITAMHWLADTNTMSLYSPSYYQRIFYNFIITSVKTASIAEEYSSFVCFRRY